MKKEPVCPICGKPEWDPCYDVSYNHFACVLKMQCCGNCKHYAAGHYHPCRFVGRNLMCHESCQADPIKWEHHDS